MQHPKGPESLQDLLGKIADNVQLTSRLIRRLPKSLASHVLSAQGAAIGPAPVVAPPQQGDGSAVDKTTPPVIPEGHYARCVRCSYTWNPRVRYPKRCPTRPDPRAADGTSALSWPRHTAVRTGRKRRHNCTSRRPPSGCAAVEINSVADLNEWLADA